MYWNFVAIDGVIKNQLKFQNVQWPEFPQHWILRHFVVCWWVQTFRKNMLPSFSGLNWRLEQYIYPKPCGSGNSVGNITQTRTEENRIKTDREDRKEASYSEELHPPNTTLTTDVSVIHWIVDEQNVTVFLQTRVLHLTSRHCDRVTQVIKSSFGTESSSWMSRWVHATLCCFFFRCVSQPPGGGGGFGLERRGGNNRELFFRWWDPHAGDLWVLSVNITTGNRETVSCRGSYVLQTDFQPLKMSIKLCRIYRLWRREREREILLCGKRRCGRRNWNWKLEKSAAPKALKKEITCWLWSQTLYSG
jgi:hypothetical protein